MQASIKNVQEINTVVTEPGNNKKSLSNEIKGLKKKMCMAYFIYQVTCLFTKAFFSLTSTASISTTTYH